MRIPDVNVLLYAINPDARQHVPARRWLEAAYRDPAGVGFPWAVTTGFLRVSTLRHVLPKPLLVADALQFVDEWLSHPRAQVLTPTTGHAALLGRLLIGAGRAGNLVSDAHLAAIAMEHGAILGSFDTDFERFAGLRFQHLVANAVQDKAR
ncbi:MAG TPA: TA system VapC family ribonuclease toxin [Rhodanobacteraceae bacterium]